ncbi:hypothetical protein NDU88_003852 [Pleurodeles waltl]|uniref:Peptidase A2 domain-containing protein n=2 Tax=Pleurodeles waltl TaxID=8319 RepID=A0AAV7VFF0_PLEWA|nr:hypothetical protein NDU88_003852 [Pleurodeles waltl]
MKSRVLWSRGKRPTYTLTVLLNDIERTALVDSGCSQSVIRQNLVLPGQGNPQSQVLIVCVHGDQRPYPVATVHLNWKGEDETITVGVIPNLGEDLNLGTDYVDFTSLLEKAGQEHVNNAWWEEAPFGVSEEETRKPRIKLSRKQKREQQWKHQNLRDPRNPDPNPPPAIICTTTGDFRQCSHEDPTLKHAWHQALHPDGHVIRHSPGSLMMNAEFLLRYPSSERLYQPLARGSVCDGPTRGDPYTRPTDAGGAPVLPVKEANQWPLPTLKQGPETGNTGPRRKEKPAVERRGARNRGAEDSGADGVNGETRRKQEDEEEAGGGTDISAAQEA